MKRWRKSIYSNIGTPIVPKYYSRVKHNRSFRYDIEVVQSSKRIDFDDVEPKLLNWLSEHCKSHVGYFINEQGKNDYRLILSFNREEDLLYFKLGYHGIAIA